MQSHHMQPLANKTTFWGLQQHLNTYKQVCRHLCVPITQPAPRDPLSSIIDCSQARVPVRQGRGLCIIVCSDKPMGKCQPCATCRRLQDRAKEHLSTTHLLHRHGALVNKTGLSIFCRQTQLALARAIPRDWWTKWTVPRPKRRQLVWEAKVRDIRKASRPIGIALVRKLLLCIESFNYSI